MIKQCCQEKLDAIEDLVSKSLIDSFISQEDFLSVNKLLREYNEMGEEIKNPENFVAYIIQKQWTNILSVARKILRTKIPVLEKLNKLD